MKQNKLLLPHACKSVGWVMLGIGAILFVLWLTLDFDFSFNDIRRMLGMSTLQRAADNSILTNFTVDTELMYTTLSLLFIIGGLLVGFSRCRQEDEFTEHIRYRALTVTMYILLATALITEIFCWGISAMVVSMVLHMLFPVFYVLYLHITLYVERRRYEE